MIPIADGMPESVHKTPGLSRGETGRLKSVNYFEEVIGAGAGAGAGADGQQEAARNAAAAAMNANLVIFIMVGQMWLLSLIGRKNSPVSGRTLAEFSQVASIDCSNSRAGKVANTMVSEEKYQFMAEIVGDDPIPRDRVLPI